MQQYWIVRWNILHSATSSTDNQSFKGKITLLSYEDLHLSVDTSCCHEKAAAASLRLLAACGFLHAR